MGNSFERWGLRAVGIAGILTGLADFADPFLTTPSLSGLISSVGLAMIGGLLLFLASDAARTDEHRAELRRHLERQDAELEGIRALLVNESLDRLDKVPQLLKPNIALLGAAKAKSLVEELRDLVRRETFEWRDADAFRTFYLDTLKGLGPGVTLIATSRTETHYFWNGTQVASEMKAFIERGGTVRRAFFVDDDRRDAPDLIRILDNQASLGVQVFTVDSACLGGSRRLILADDARDFGWEVFTTDDGKIERALVTAESEKLAQFRQFLNRVRACPSLKPYGSTSGSF
ncbi:hypothetical protein [Brevundimonas lenta]|uniref:Uncharacterized protein n=1 Tax=Brevundimonas lenta TaxID=424796 RepID=A0A7W6NMF7_9CAUL|nr:hypothetical protein [Brevundimonas lenta]MBB4081315.1 hypothetical protein [Brevundimonas lenta]